MSLQLILDFVMAKKQTTTKTSPASTSSPGSPIKRRKGGAVFRSKNESEALTTCLKIIGRDTSDAEAGLRVRDFFGSAEALEVVFQLDKLLCENSSLVDVNGSDVGLLRGCISDDRCKHFVRWLKENTGGVHGPNGVLSSLPKMGSFLVISLKRLM